MSEKIIFQSIKVIPSDVYDMAEKYYEILSVVNNLHLTTRQIQLVAFTAIHGNISYNDLKEDFCKKYKSSSATIGNIICQLKKVKVLVKHKDRIKVNPAIVLDFKKDIILKLNLYAKA